MYGLIPNQELQPGVIIASAMARIVNTTNKDAIADSADIKANHCTIMMCIMQMKKSAKNFSSIIPRP